MPGAIEFVDSGDAEPPPSPRRAARRWWLLGLVAVLAAATAFALTRAEPAPRPRAAPSPPPTRTGFAVPDHALATPPANQSTSRCGAAPLCAVSFLVPDRLGAALRARLPRISDLRVETSLAQSLNTGGAYLAQRVIYLRNPAALLKITVVRIAGAVAPPEATALGVVRVRLRTPAFVIDVLSYPTAHAPLARAALRALAADPRLEVV